MATQYIEDPETKERIPFEWNRATPPTSADIDSLFTAVKQHRSSAMATQYIEDPETKERIPFEWNRATPPTSADIDSLFTAVKQHRGQPEKIERSVGSRIAHAVAPYARPVLETGGLVLGGAAGGALGGAAGGIGAIPGAVVGAGAGYAGGRRLANAVEEYAGDRKPTTFVNNLANTGMDVAEGGAMEAGGQVTNYLLKPVAEKALPWLAKQTYRRVLKPLPSIPKGEADTAVRLGLEKGYGVSESGLNKAAGRFKTLTQAVDDVVKGMEQTTGKSEKGAIHMKDVVKNVGGPLLERYGNLPEGQQQIVEDLLKEYAKKRGGYVTPVQAQEMKKDLYRYITDSAYGEMASAQKETLKQVARGIREALLSKDTTGTLNKLNKEEADHIIFREILERTVNRSGNWDILGLSDLAGAGAGAVTGGYEEKSLGGASEGAIVGATVARALRSPAFMSRIAILLAKGAKTNPNPLLSRLPMYFGLRKSDEGQ